MYKCKNDEKTKLERKKRNISAMPLGSLSNDII